MDDFDKHKLQSNDTFMWVQVSPGTIETRTKRGDFRIIQKHHLWYKGSECLTYRLLGRFKYPKAKARRYFNEDAI